MDARRRFERAAEAARGYLALDMPAQALREIGKTPPDGEIAFDFYSLRGEAFRQQKQFAEALHEFEQADSLSPDDLSILMGMAWCLKRVDRLPDAIAMMHRAQKLFEKIPVVQYNLACYYALAGEKDQALSWLGRALRMDAGLRALIPDEKDFDSLRDDPDFQHLLELTEKKERR